MTEKKLKALIASLAVERKAAARRSRKIDWRFEKNAQQAARRSKELDRRLEKNTQKTAKNAQEAAQRSKELDQRLERNAQEAAQRSKEINQQLKETSQMLKEATRDIKKLEKNLAGIGISIGDSAEEFFYRYFKRHPQLGQWHFHAVERNLKPRHREYDLALINGDLVVLASIKQKLRNEDIRHLRDKEIPAFRQDYPEFKDHRLYGALGAMVISQDKERLAQKNGFYVFAQSGERVEVITPNGSLKAY